MIIKKIKYLNHCPFSDMQRNIFYYHSKLKLVQNIMGETSILPSVEKTFHKSRFTKRNDNICLYIIAYFHFLYISTSRSICVHAFTIINYLDGVDLGSGLCKFSIFVPISTSYSIYFVAQTYLLQKFR